MAIRLEVRQTASGKPDLEILPVLELFRKVLLYKPHHNTDGPNPKLLCPWRGPCTIRAQLSPVVYRVRPSSRDGGGVSVHLAHLKPHREQAQQPGPGFAMKGALLPGDPVPLPALRPEADSRPRMESRVVDKIVGAPASTGQTRTAQLLFTGCGYEGTGRLQDSTRRAR